MPVVPVRPASMLELPPAASGVVASYFLIFGLYPQQMIREPVLVKTSPSRTRAPCSCREAAANFGQAEASHLRTICSWFPRPCSSAQQYTVFSFQPAMEHPAALVAIADIHQLVSHDVIQQLGILLQLRDVDADIIADCFSNRAVFQTGSATLSFFEPPIESRSRIRCPHHPSHPTRFAPGL